MKSSTVNGNYSLWHRVAQFVGQDRINFISRSGSWAMFRRMTSKA
jgi:hypothetical protein